MTKFIAGGEIFMQLHQAGFLDTYDPTTIRRVVIDLQVGEVARVYVDTYAEKEKLTAALGAGITVKEAA